MAKWLLFPVIVAASLVLVPSFWVYLFMFVDRFTSWNIFQSKLYDQYHQFLLNRLPERPELPVPEIPLAEATRENIIRISKGYTFPVIIRGLLGESEGVKKWQSPEWWIENYPNDEVLCSKSGPYLAEQIDNCTISKFYAQLKTDEPYYIVGATSIFDKHPELHDMVNNEHINAIEPGPRIATQVFIGLPGTGSDIHCAAGVNVFRQVTGRKRWWFIPPSQTAYLKPALNKNGFSAFSHTLVGKDGKRMSPWFNKIERYSAIVYPGDVLINPPWFWHGILNLGDPKHSERDLTIGCPSRYGRAELMKAGIKSNWVFFVVSFISVAQKYGLNMIFQGRQRMELQKDIEDNRNTRNVKDGHASTTTTDPFEIESAEG